MTALPTGTVTFLFTDIEGSTRLLQQLGDRNASVLADYRRLLGAAVEERGGHQADTQGDALFAFFPSAREALAAAIAAQRSILRHLWPDAVSVRVRMGLHTGEALASEIGYVGMDVHRAARICAAGHGGQILLSDTTHALVARELPNGVSLRDLGEHRLKDLAHAHRLFQVLAADLPADFPPLKSLNVLPNNLPLQLTSFIGRGREIADIKTMLATARLLTLTGAGGSGKTRLALQVGADLLEQYSDGVWLVELAALVDPALIPQAVATTVGVPEQPGRALNETLVDSLRPKLLLLVLDNCEHVLAACARLANVLLRACPEMRILATSREGLGIAGETLYPVPTLPVPDERLPPTERLVQYESVRLFTERATAVLPTFKVTPQNAYSVAQICRRLDGIPLALELAAVRVKILTVDQIVARLGDRFRLLTGGSQTALPRHQTLQATMDWSYGLLAQKEQVMLRRLSVFAEGCTLDAAEAVCSGNGVERSEVLDLLAQLADKSLVLVAELAWEARYSLLETVRQYGANKLMESGETADVRYRHLNWCLELAERGELELRGPNQGAWLERLELDHDNLRTALEWCQAREGDAELELRLAAALRRFWLRRGHWSEGRKRPADMLSRGEPQQSSPARAKALHAAGALAQAQDDVSEALSYFHKALAAYQQLQDKLGTAASLYSLGIIAHIRGDQAAARLYLEKSMVIFRESGDKPGIAMVVNDLGEDAAIRGDYTAARLMLDESLAIWRELGDKRGIGAALNDLGELARLQGDHRKAAALYQDSLAFHTESGSKSDVNWVRHDLAVAILRLGDHQRAAELLRESLTGYFELRSASGVALSMAGLASAAIAKGQMGRGARLLSISAHLFDLTGGRLDLVDQREFNQNIAVARASTHEEAFAAAWAEGRAMTLEQAVEYALKENEGPSNDDHA